MIPWAFFYAFLPGPRRVSLIVSFNNWNEDQYMEKFLFDERLATCQTNATSITPLKD
ncbi:hypothetical protein ACG2F4_10715 [Halalkalibaculum sp. DA3122]|uniref:hypothetical protein n=1 Tax=unclassified Halalkalibaculum TaxID=2964617 RepID=UPI0037542E42